MIVIGAGMAGLLAGAMLRNDCSGIYESQEKIPNNHSAVLRFRSTVVADTLNIPFKEVQVMKAVQPWRNPIADAMAYSYKNTGTSSLRSITSAQGELETRYICPPDFIQRMACCITAPFEFGRKADNLKSDTLTISTIPMPTLMEILGWETTEKFSSVDGANIKAKIKNMDAYLSLYVPDPDYPGSRISVTGNEMTIECPGANSHSSPEWWLRSIDIEKTVAKAGSLIGVNVKRITDVAVREQKYAKILPIDDNHRKRFILWATEHFNIYSLGRFATWRPGLLLDDVVNDVRVICRLADGEAAYHAALAAEMGG
jgi:hypothetical protein